MKKSILLMALCALLAACHIDIKPDSSSPSGTAATRVLDIDGTYKALEVSSAFHVVMSDTVTVPTVTVAERMMDKVVVLIENRTLKIGFKPGHIRLDGDATVLLPYNETLRSVELSGASHFTSTKPMGRDLAKVEASGASVYEGDLSGATVEIELSGASYFRGSVDAGTLDIEASGASHAVVSGTCNHEMELDISGASDVDARDLDATTVRGEVGGASNVDVTICDELRLEASGASHITYKTLADGCEPAIRVSTTGASTIRQR